MKKDFKATHKSSYNIELQLLKAWQDESPWLKMLLPVSYIYGGIINIRQKLYQRGILKRYRARVPVLVVGNITVGGSGKTPLIINLVRYLQAKRIQVGVISRGYGGNETMMPALVTAHSSATEVGDEPCLIVAKTGVDMAVCPNRQQAIECLLAYNPEIELIIADDGLQHYKLYRDIEWIVVDSSRGFGNKQLLPSGFLREPLSRLNDATVIYHQTTASDSDSFADSDSSTNEIDSTLTMHLEPSGLVPLTNQSEDSKPGKDNKNRVIYAMGGIGYPKRFFDTLRALGFEVIERPKPDHHQYSMNDFRYLNHYPVVVTSKDAVKINSLLENHPELHDIPIWILPVTTVLSDNCYARLDTQLKAVGISI